MWIGHREVNCDAGLTEPQPLIQAAMERMWPVGVTRSNSISWPLYSYMDQ